MSIKEATDLKQRLKEAWSNFEKKASAEQIAAARRALERHSNALINSDAQAAKASEFSLVKSVLEDRLEDDLGNLLSKFYPEVSEIGELAGRPEFEIEVLDDGEILGTGKYEVLDVNWLEAGIVWLDHYFDTRRFPRPGPWIEIPDSTGLAIFGDWGGGCWQGNAVAREISSLIKDKHPDYSIHLGDVYYAGEPDQETDYLLELWPTARKGNFTLNSNHEMYPMGKGYFDTALPNELFKCQRSKSFFALENSNWIIVGLDSAFHGDKNDMYMTGGIGTTQCDFLQQVAGKDKQVIALSHHNPLDITGASKQPLWHQVTSQLGGTLKYWYWGHIHGGAVYKPVDGVNCRLTGHGVIPWGNAKSLEQSPNVDWYEHHKPDPVDGVRVQNGFVFVTLQGDQLTEAFYGEDGKVHWPLS